MSLPDPPFAVEQPNAPLLTESPHSDRQPTTQGATIRVALPAYNEQESLETLVHSLNQTLSQMGNPYEIIVVDDGSSDDTAEIASRLSYQVPLRLVQHDENQGLAAALRTGLSEAIWDSASDDLIVTMDSDNTQPPGLIPRMVQMIGEGHDVVIASRFQPGSRVVGVPIERVWLSIAARWIFRFMLPIRGVRDYTCGFRVYRADILAAAEQHYGDRFVSEAGFSCMVDVLLKLRRLRFDGARIVMGEAPMILRYDQKGGTSKMRVLRTIWQTLSLVVRRRLRG